MTTRYLLIKKKTGKNPVGAVKLKPGVSAKKAVQVARKSLRSGLAIAGVVSSLQLRKLIVKLRPRRKTVKRKVTKRRVTRKKKK